MGLILGLTGSGGSILTVPLLVLLFRFTPVEATAQSLFVVGTTAAIASLANLRSPDINRPALVWFGIPSIAAIMATRRLIVPQLPSKLGSISLDDALLFAFVALMLASLFALYRPKPTADPNIPIQPARLITQGLLVGLIAGLLGAGGGFLIVPALILVAALPIQSATATSLALIGINSLSGFFVSAASSPEPIRWPVLLAITALATVGSLGGRTLAPRLPKESLKHIFATVVFVTATVTLIHALR